MQEYEEQDEGEEPGLWTRLRGLLLRLTLQLYHRLLKQRDALRTLAQGLGEGASRVRLHHLHHQPHLHRLHHPHHLHHLHHQPHQPCLHHLHHLNHSPIHLLGLYWYEC